MKDIEAKFTPEINLTEYERRWIRKAMEAAAFQTEKEIRKIRARHCDREAR